jgi:Cu-processing system ATP-binding protein
MINIANVEKSFGSLQVLRGVNFKAGAGQCVALVGPNGCGKTTLLKCLLGMVVPDAGTIEIGGTDIAGDWRYRAQIGYMPQIGRYPDQMKIGQVVGMLSDIRDQQQIKDDELLKSFSLQALYHKRMGTLSGGTLQKVSAVIAFMNDPSVLILDEPTAGLDPVSAEILCDKIRAEQARGKLIIITSHILSELDDLVSHVAYMQEGNLLLYKTLDELKDETGTKKLSRAIASVMTSQKTC